MSDAREALARLVRTLDAKSAEDQERLGHYWDRGLADGDVQEDVYRRTDAILAEFDVTPRGSSEQPGVHLCANPDAPDHPPHGMPLYIESWGTCDARPAPVVLNSPHGLGCLPGCGHDRSEAAAPDSEHDHEWQRRQNVTSRGCRMTPYEVCVVDGCGAARQVDEPATFDHEPEWEYGVKWGDEPDHNPPAICGSREHAESRAAESHGDKIVRRTKKQVIPAGPWKEVPSE